jgi:tRNA A-37 threonylcarbamoyl transferase component Bud32
MVSRVLYACSLEWAASIGERLEDLLHGPEFRVIKQTSRTVAGIAHVNGGEVFVKRVRNHSWLKGIIARICGSRARKSIRGAKILEHAGLAHPRLIAAFEERRRGSIRASYVIAEYLRRPKVLSRVALADGRDFFWRRSFGKQIAQAIRDLHDAGCYTRDLQETNLMLEIRNDNVKIYFTDLEAIRWLPLVPWRLRLHNLIQLDRSIGRFISSAHRLRFLHRYLGTGAGRAEVRAVVTRLHQMRGRIERRKLTRRRSTAIVTPA